MRSTLVCGTSLRVPGFHVSPPMAYILPSRVAPAMYARPRGRSALASWVHLEPAAAIGSNRQVSVNTAPKPSAEKPPNMYILLSYTANPPGMRAGVAGHGSVETVVIESATGLYTRTTG